MGKETVCQTIPPGAVDIHFSDNHPFALPFFRSGHNLSAVRLARTDEALRPSACKSAPRQWPRIRPPDGASLSAPRIRTAARILQRSYFLLNSALDP